MRMLDRKVLRDAVHLKGQLTAIAVLVACGVAVFIMLRSMNGYLNDSQAAYYDDYRFPDVFAHTRRAPAAAERAIATIPGVDRVATRIVVDVLLEVPGLDEPATGRVVSLPDYGEPALNRLHLRSGRMPEAGRRDQVLVSPAFAEANRLGVGDRMAAVLNGRWQQVVIVGTAISPEFVYEISGYGAPFPDNRRFGAMWMSRSAMEAAWQMAGAFNDVGVTLAPGASAAAVRAAMDDVLESYGGTGAYGRDDHLSHTFVSSEIQETEITATFFPAMFLIVTAFLLHTTLLRLVQMEREQIGLMKAFGLDSRTVALHYTKLALLPVAAGGLLGAALGVWLAGRMAGVYARFYQFPRLDFTLDLRVVWTALAIAFLTGIAGALAAARRVVRLAPAVAMAPPAPPRFRAGLLERTAAWRALGPSGRMIVRSLLRARWKSISTIAGIALALGVLSALLGMFDAIDVIGEIEFERIQREDIAVYFNEPRASGAIDELAHLPGVLRAEPMRMAPVRLVHGHRELRSALFGIGPGTELRRIVDADFRTHPAPVAGVLIGAGIARELGLRAGDPLRVEVTDGTRPKADVVVAGVVDELISGQVYMDTGELHRLLGEGAVASGALLRIDPAVRGALYEELRRRPGVAIVLVKASMRRSFDETIEESFMISLLSTLFLGTALVMAIVYNQARIALSERGRDLASLRVLGFQRREVAGMLLGEQSLLVAFALPFGLALGWLLTLLIMMRFDTELFRLPVVVDPRTYTAAAGLVVVAAAGSAVLVRRRLDRIDLISVLKTRE